MLGPDAFYRYYTDRERDLCYKLAWFGQTVDKAVGELVAGDDGLPQRAGITFLTFPDSFQHPDEDVLTRDGALGIPREQERLQHAMDTI